MSRPRLITLAICTTTVGSAMIVGNQESFFSDNEKLFLVQGENTRMEKRKRFLKKHEMRWNGCKGGHGRLRRINH